MRKLPALAVALALAGCDGGFAQRSVQNDTLILYARDKVRARMLDPERAIFANERVTERRGRRFVCGEVNGRNAFGGMAGRARFVVGGDTAIETEFRPEDFAHIWGALC